MKKTCKCCGIEYNAKRSSSKYCSRDCQIKARTKRIQVKCDYCGKEIERIPARLEKAENNFCSRDCQGKWNSQHKVGTNHPSYTQIEVKCDYCNKSFLIQPYKLKECEKHYCSRECQHNSLCGRHLSEEHKQKVKENTPRGKNSPHWKPEKTDEERLIGRATPEDHEWKTSVLKRDDYTCQCCNKRGGNLNAHHLNGYHWDVEHRHDVNNGVTLCIHCHKEFHKLYGNKNNTREQYEQFINNKTF